MTKYALYITRYCNYKYIHTSLLWPDWKWTCLCMWLFVSIKKQEMHCHFGSLLEACLCNYLSKRLRRWLSPKSSVIASYIRVFSFHRRDWSSCNGRVSNKGFLSNEITQPQANVYNFTILHNDNSNNKQIMKALSLWPTTDKLLCEINMQVQKGFRFGSKM